MVTLRPITDANRRALEALTISPLQENFVTTVADSLLEAGEEPDGRAITWGVYDDDTPVGFVMISDDVGVPGTSRSTSGSSSSTSATSGAGTARRRSTSSSSTSALAPV